MYWVGCVAFLLFLAGDVNDLKFHIPALKLCFGVGLLLLTIATAGLIAQGNSGIADSAILTAPQLPLAIKLMIGAIGLFFFTLLIYTLFFALPFQNTYVSAVPADQKNPVCTGGIYALCRHPGVLWFFFFYLCLWASVGLPWFAAATYSALNLIYAAIQDRLIFPSTLEGYFRYRETTPFLIPNPQSIKRCLADYKKSEV